MAYDPFGFVYPRNDNGRDIYCRKPVVLTKRNLRRNDA
jgi:hypothetical protein